MICVGVDIGRSGIKIAEVEHLNRGFVFKRFIELPLSNDPTKDKKIEVIDHLRNLSTQYGHGQVQFILGLPQEQISQRFLSFPFRERHKILKIVPFELEDDIPMNFGDSIFDAKVVRFRKKTAEVLALAALKEDIQEQIDLMRDGGIHANILSGQGLALSNLLEKWYLPPPEASSSDSPVDTEETQIFTEKPGEMLLDLGHSTSRVLFYEEGLLVAIRNLDWGGKNISDALASKYSLNPLQARKEMEKKAFILLDKEKGQKDQILFSETIEEAFAPLINQLRLSALEVQSQFNLKWVRAHVVGGPALVKGLTPFLTQKMEVPFNLFHHFQLLSDIRFDVDPQKEMKCATALGLALEGLRKPRNPAVNFLKGEFAVQSKTLQEFWDKWAYTAKLVGVAFIAFFIYSSLRQSFMDEALIESEVVLKQQAQSIANKRGAEASPSRLRRFLSQHKKEVMARDKAKELMNLKTPLDFINTLSQDLPSSAGLEVKHIFIEEDFLEIHGDVRSRSAITQIQGVLKNISQDNRVTGVRSKTAVAPGKSGFSYRIRINRRGES